MTPRAILVSGASRGIGRALVEHYLDRGDRVFGCARGESTVESDRYTYIPADVTSEDDVKQLFREIRKETPHLDALINNAGAARMLPMALTPSETARKILDVNFMGSFHLTHGAIRLLRKSECPRIVNLTTVAVPWRLEGEAVYAASKSAVETLTRVAAKELGSWGITCNAVGPSPIRTDLIKKVAEDKLQTLIDRQSIPEWAEIGDVINVVDFFLRPESRLITGQVVYLGGAG